MAQHKKNKITSPSKIISLSATLFIFIILALTPTANAQAQNFQFEDPLGMGNQNPITFIENRIFAIGTFLLSFSAAIALVVILYAGIKLIIGGATSESEIASAKRILFWAVAGLLVIGGAATILIAVAQILGFNKPFVT